jgi:DNA-binding HxlR family transcriptional regulator
LGSRIIVYLGNLTINLDIVKELSYYVGMQRTSFSEFACSVARTLDVVGEWWSPLILRDVFLGVTRFERIQEDLGIPRKVLAERLATMVEHGVLERTPYRDGRTRHEYHLTDKGRDFLTALIALMNWGDHWLAGNEGAPVHIIHDDCGGMVETALTCKRCGKTLEGDEVHGEPGPGARAARGTAFLGRMVGAERTAGLAMRGAGALRPKS